ncbi:MAG TPA: SIMPL domain-containing protein [Acidimicrobiales bacterium]|nr:SIMPL domain-containing protein [Acidimicrobiales bacterium]
MEPEIVVRGTAEARALPDRARLRVDVTADHRDQDAAYRARAEIAARVDAVLAEHAAAVDRTTVAGLRVQPRTRWANGRELHEGWRASRTTLVELVGLDALGPIMAGLVEAGAAVTGPDWTLAPTNPAHAEARRGAAEDARLRAAAYAEALGLDLGPVAWVSEPGLRKGVPAGGPPPVTRGTAVAFRAADAEPPAEDLPASEMTVEAAVEVGFRIL